MGARVLAWTSWILLVAAVLLAAFCLLAPWAINAEGLGKTDMGLALGLSFTYAFAIYGAIFSAPVLAVIGLVFLSRQRASALRFLGAAALCGLPIAVLAWRG